MNKQSIIDLLESRGFLNDSGRTQLHQYTTPNLHSLLRQSTGNRNNVGWVRGEYVIYTQSQDEELDDLLAGWYRETASYKNQYLILETIDGQFKMFDSDCNLIAENEEIEKRLSMSNSNTSRYGYFLPAIRTKPFLLLAGISGTGKSQIVKEMAFVSCPDIDDLRKDAVSPGNYCLIEVKPNWHDSIELLGYDSAIKKRYVVTKFVKFVVKAMRYPNVPFFVCLDEMNLAPVEQYFAEFLSVLESRKLVAGHIISEPLIDKSFFKNNLVALDLFDLPASEYKSLANVTGVEQNDDALGENAGIWHKLQDEGLCLPQNLIVIGTVNMDETTHQFSRKVIDRAMTFEMNQADFRGYFADNVNLNYVNKEDVLPKKMFLAKNVRGIDAFNNNPQIGDAFIELIVKKLEEINCILIGTPFRIAYRVQNELILYFFELLEEVEQANKDWDVVFYLALDDIMMMKVLPRIEGDDDLLGTKDNGILYELHNFAQTNNLGKSAKKIEEMLSRLSSHFTSFWP